MAGNEDPDPEAQVNRKRKFDMFSKEFEIKICVKIEATLERRPYFFVNIGKVEKEGDDEAIDSACDWGEMRILAWNSIRQVFRINFFNYMMSNWLKTCETI